MRTTQWITLKIPLIYYEPYYCLFIVTIQYCEESLIFCLVRGNILVENDVDKKHSSLTGRATEVVLLKNMVKIRRFKKYLQILVKIPPNNYED
jgi:hypothetical protein